MLTTIVERAVHCQRCDLDVIGEVRFPRIRMLAWAYVALGIPGVVAFPFFAWDYVVSLPGFMLYALGFAQVISILRERPTCPDCGAITEPLPPAAKGQT
jgi:hypothetical protein